jgi:hypothetical protein
MTPGAAVASFDSASAMLRALAGFHRGKAFAHLGQHPVKTVPVRASTLLPTTLRQSAYAVAGALEGTRPRALGDVDMNCVGEWVTGHYPPGRYPVVFVGASNGAVVHLAAALGAAWLPQTLLLPVRRWRAGGADSADPAAALAFGARVAGPFLARNPDIVLHHMHDPIQDELMVRHMAYFRVKRARLGAAYERWLQQSLAPGAPLVLVEDLSRWPTTQVGDRHLFQNGAQGGIGPEGYTGLRPDGDSPEAEWGFAPELADDVHRWATAHGHPVHRLRFDHPEALSPPVADLHRRWGADRGATDRLLVESFVLLDPFQVARTGSAPLWTIFPVAASARRVREFLDTRPRFTVIDVLLFNHGVVSAGLAEASVWQELVDSGERPGSLLGVRSDQFPVDFAALARYGPALRGLETAPRPAERRQLQEVMQVVKAADDVTWEEREG